MNAPVINELAVCLECKVKSYDQDTCILKGEIVNVSVDESALTDGKVDVRKVAPICFDPFNNACHVIGEKVGDAWGSGRELDHCKEIGDVGIPAFVFEDGCVSIDPADAGLVEYCTDISCSIEDHKSGRKGC